MHEDRLYFLQEVSNHLVVGLIHLSGPSEELVFWDGFEIMEAIPDFVQLGLEDAAPIDEDMLYGAKGDVLGWGKEETVDAIEVVSHKIIS